MKSLIFSILVCVVGFSIVVYSQMQPEVSRVNVVKSNVAPIAFRGVKQDLVNAKRKIVRSLERAGDRNALREAVEWLNRLERRMEQLERSINNQRGSDRGAVRMGSSDDTSFMTLLGLVVSFVGVVPGWISLKKGIKAN